MACARCDFYTPKDSSRAQLLEAKDNLQTMAVSIPLTEDEQAALTDGQTAIDKPRQTRRYTDAGQASTPADHDTRHSSAPTDRWRPTGQGNASLANLIPQKSRSSGGPCRVRGVHRGGRSPSRMSASMWGARSSGLDAARHKAPVSWRKSPGSASGRMLPCLLPAARSLVIAPMTGP